MEKDNHGEILKGVFQCTFGGGIHSTALGHMTSQVHVYSDRATKWIGIGTGSQEELRGTQKKADDAEDGLNQEKFIVEKENIKPADASTSCFCTTRKELLFNKQ